jgi:hypothetical protein
MKNTKIVALLSLVMGIPLVASCDRNEAAQLEATSKTTLTVHPLFVSQQPELVSGFRNDRNLTRENGWGGAFQAVLFGSETMDEEDLAQYFFPDANTSLIAANDGPPQQPGFNVKKDLLAQDFNVFTNNNNFESTISIRPKQSVIGLGLHVRQSVWKSHAYNRGVWFSFSAPIMRVRNNMNFFEDVTNDGGGVNEAANNVVVANMTEAFQQSDWNYGKISTCSMSKTGLGDIEAKVGYEWLDHSPTHMESYFGLVIPTGNKNNGEYVFQPIVGRGKNFGIMFGSSLGIDLWESASGEMDIRYELANHFEWLFQNTQKRSFDLKNRPWSRYLPVYASQEDAQEAADLAVAGTNAPFAMNNSTPGINVFTQEVKVTPGLTTDINTAFQFTWKKFQAEAGYNFLAKRAENVKLKCPWQTGPAIKHYLGDGTTNPIRTIDGNKYDEQIVANIVPAPIPADQIIIPVSVANYEMSLIQEGDLNLNSAATPALFANTLYATVGFHAYDREYPLFGNVGASYTFSKNNDAVPRRWVLWGKMGLSY